MNKEEKNAAPAAEAPERGKLFTSRNIAWFAILLALTVVLQIWGSAIRIGANTLIYRSYPGRARGDFASDRSAGR
ncbi:MAG: hypothetical protein ACLUHK_05520 [Eubacteriales bacterium]